MKVIALINTTIAPLDKSPEEIRDARENGEPESSYRATISKGQTYEVPDEKARSWIKLGIAKAADPAGDQPTDSAAKKADAANNGQAADNPALNLQNPELATEGQVAVSRRIKRLAEEAAQSASESASH